jgi:hypothetical protein
MIWEGKESYPNVAEALADADEAIGRWANEAGLW